MTVLLRVSARTIRQLPGVIAWLAALVQMAHAQQSPFRPEVAIQKTDYADVRRTFRTALIHRGASPQETVISRMPSNVSLIEYNSGGRRLHAWVGGEPTRHVKLPAVVFLHGGFSFASDDWEMALPYWTAGFVVMAPLLRGENGQPGSFSFLYDEVEDVEAAVAFLRTRPDVDTSRIYLAGHSAGATIALLTAEASREFRAVATFDGSPDQQLLYHGSASKPGTHNEVVFDTTDLREFQVRSPLAYAASLKSPVRMYYSSEAAVLFKYPTERLTQVARARGLDVAAIAVNGTHVSHVSGAMGQSIEFFKRNMGAGPARLLQRRTAPAPQPSVAGNTTFRLRGYADARVVTLAGSFNGWNSRDFRFAKENGHWVCRVDLAPGKYLYKFVVDGVWISDPENSVSETEPNGDNNSVLVKTRQDQPH